MHQLLTNARFAERKSKINLQKLKNTAKLYKMVGNYTPSNFISKVNRPRSAGGGVNLYRDFLDLETYKISSMIPDISFHKVVNGKYIPFYFPVAADSVTPQSILTPGFGINGVGIKSFSLSFTGNNPFDFDKQIEANLVVFVDNLQSIFNDPPEGYAPLAELFTISRSSSTPLKGGLSKEVAVDQVNRAFSHEISARVGYSVDPNTRIFTQAERAAITNTAISVRMTLTDHTITVNQDGTATITIDFIGRLEGLRSDNNLNLLADVEEIAQRANVTSPKSKEKKIGSSKKEKPNKESRRKKLKNTHTKMRRIFTYLEPKGLVQKTGNFDASRIYQVQLSNMDIETFREYGNKTKIEAQLSEIEQNRRRDLKRVMDIVDQAGMIGDEELQRLSMDHARDMDNEISRKYGPARNSLVEKNKAIHYVYLGDLLESVIYNSKYNIELAMASRVTPYASETLKKSLDQLNRINILFGTVPLRISENKTKNVNLADIPISLGILQKYFFEQVEQRHKKKLSFKGFVDDLVAVILPRALKGHSFRDAPFLSSGARIESINITGPNLSTPPTKVDVDIDDLPDFIRKRTPKEEKDESEYYVIFAEVEEKASSGFAGDIQEDLMQGIYHFHIGKDRGLLKTIQFSKDDVPYRKEALMVESVNLYDELKMPYKADISMVGNNLFLPGTQIYINPSSIGFGDPRSRRSAAARLGIGGYYQVISVNTTFDGSSMTTSLNAMYTSWADNDKAFVGEMTKRKEQNIDRTPESHDIVLETSSLRPEFEEVTTGDYSGISESLFLTEQEKGDIITMDMSRKQLASDSVSFRINDDGSRTYTVRRSGPSTPLSVNINEDNSVTISKRGGGY